MSQRITRTTRAVVGGYENIDMERRNKMEGGDGVDEVLNFNCIILRSYDHDTWVGLSCVYILLTQLLTGDGDENLTLVSMWIVCVHWL
jgi:hypothetical protein